MEFRYPFNNPNDWYQYHAYILTDLLKGYIRDVEFQINSSIENFEKNKEDIIMKEHPEFGYAEILTIHQGIENQTWDLDGIFKEKFPSMQRSSTLISLFGFLENELDKLCNLIQNSTENPVELKDFAGKGIERSTRYLAKVGKLDNIKKTDYWRRIKEIQKIRNLVVHNDSKLTDLNDELKNEESRIVLNSEYLNGEYRIDFNPGYLDYVLENFEKFFKTIDDEIKKHLPTPHKIYAYI